MNLYCERYPNHASHDILFIHGNLASSRWWQPTLAEWKKIGSPGKRSLIFADWRGCGHNPDWSSGETFTLDDLAQDFFELLDRERLEKVHIVGHSLGGLIALKMMIQKPERFYKAFLLDPVGAQGVVFDDSMYEAFRQMALSPELTKTVILSTIQNADRLERKLQDGIAEDGYKAVRGIGTSVLEILKSVDIRDRVQKVNVPTLVVHGEKDQIIPLKDSETLTDLMPHARLEVLSDAGHCWNVENPKAFVTRLKNWLEEN